MEKTMSVEERIRRAEERYNKKNNWQTANVQERIDRTSQNDKYSKNDGQNSNISIKRTKRLLMQIFVCLVIYIAFYTINNREYIFSENFKNDVNIFLTEKTKIAEMYSDAKSYIENKLSGNKEVSDNPEQTEGEENKEEEKKEENSDKEKTEEPKEEKKEDENVGGAEENVSDINEDEGKTQMEKDAKKIKSTISFIKPVEGRISSAFGWRNPTVSTVPKNHTGLDIAAVSGTVIKSATDGKIILASSDGDYGNHYKIQINDVIIIYAHCQKLYLKEGDNVVQGQEIAEVGSTGNSTGPHLHFEIRIEDRKVDPQLILDI